MVSNAWSPIESWLILISGALHEVRESEELASWVEAQNKFVKSDSGRFLIGLKLLSSDTNFLAIIDQLQKQNLALIDELEELKLDRYNGAKAKSVLDPKFFLENSPNHLPQIPKIALAGIRPALISAESYAKITNRE